MSKLCIYRVYVCFKDHFKDKMKRLYRDTDSFYLHVECEDLYIELIDTKTLRNWIDFSDIPANHPSGIGNYTTLNPDVLGKFKNKTYGNSIVEFVGLRPKLYSYSICEAQSFSITPLPPNIKIMQTANGISRIAKQMIKHEDYVSMYNEGALCNIINHRI